MTVSPLTERWPSLPEPVNLEVVFLSDLHLGAHSPSESVIYTRAFATFLDHMRDVASTENRDCRLVLLGDALDFLKVGARTAEGRSRLETSTEAAIEKLEEIARQEPLFFVAVGRFAAAGLAVDVVPGNHDIDLVRPAVQDHFRRLVERASECTGAGDRITFQPWIYHVPGVVYAEHGHQHHDINSFATLLRPYARGDEECLDLPLAASFESSGKARTGASVLRHAVKLLHPDRRERRREYREKVLRPYAAHVGLDPATVEAIDELSEVSIGSMAARLLSKSFVHRARGGRPTQRGGYLHRATVAIHRVLASSQASAPYYVFGHTHIAERFPVLTGASPPEYLNTGTWSPRLPGGLAPRDGSPLLTFVRIQADTGLSPRGEVLVWDDTSHRSRPLDVCT